MPASSTVPTEPAFKFEVSAPSYFHLSVHAHPDKIAIDAGALKYDKQVSVGIPKVVQSTASTVYGVAAPYAIWGYGKVSGVVKAVTGGAPAPAQASGKAEGKQK